MKEEILGKEMKLRHLGWTKLFKEKSGYLKKWTWVDRAKDILLTLFFIIPLIPVFIVIIPVILVVNGRPLFYRGDRYGLNKRIFVMYKFRTLPKGFEDQHPGTLVSRLPEYRLPWFSRFLRDSRLDEFPQLYNVLKGDMDLIGPRPERPSVYNELCKKIKNYDKRFEVRPGIVGYSQLFTPHSTPKRIRSAIDNRAAKYKKGMSEFLILALAAFAVMRSGTKMLFKFLLNKVLQGEVFKKYNEKRGLDRRRIENGKVGLAFGGAFTRGFSEEIRPCGILFDINEEYFRMDSDQKLDVTQTQFVITTTINRRFSKPIPQQERRYAYCHGNICRSYQNLNKDYPYSYIIRYRPVTTLNHYFVDQYFLNKGMMRYVF